VVNFNEPVLPGIGNIQIFASSPTNGQLVSAINVATSSSVIFSGSTLTIIPPQPFASATTYYVVFPSGSVKDSAGNVYAGTSSYEFQTLSNVTPTPTPGGTNTPTGTLVAATQSQLMTAAALQTNLPEVPNTSLIGQYKLGNLTALVATYNGTNITNILSNGIDPISGVVSDSGMNLSLTGPSGVGLKMQSPSGPGDIINGTTFVNNLINQLIPGNQISSTAMQYKASIQGSLALIGQQSTAASVSATKVFTLTGAATQAVQIKENLNQTDLAVLNLNGMLQAPTVQVSNLSNVLVMGPGTVANTGSKAMNLIGDITNQTLVGGSGNDLISGGGGIDTLTGGGGVDTFYFGAPGAATITDFVGNDKFKFNIFGVKTFNDFCNSITNVVDNAQGVTFTINNNLQITIVGYHASSNWNSVSFSFV
jgi:Ca2+-binding RTX toxin-like protein